MKKADFEWDDNKNKSNQEKHHLSFEKAQYTFSDESRIIAEDLDHSQDEMLDYYFTVLTGYFSKINHKLNF